MRYLAALSLATVSLFLSSTSRAATAPINDNIRNALPLSSETNINRIEGDILGATDDPDVPVLTPTITYPYSYYAGYPVVWYKWEVPISGSVYTQLIGVGHLMWLMTVQGTPGDALFELTSPPTITIYDGAASSYTNNYNVVGGKTYYVGVLLGDPLTRSTSSAPYDFKFVQIFRPEAISDAFATRTAIGGRKFTINGLLNTLTAETDEPQHSTTSTAPARKTGWMTYTSPTRSLIKLTAESKISLPLLAVYKGDTLGALTRVAQSTGSGSGLSFSSRLSFVAEAGVPYAIAVDAEGPRAGPFTLSVEAATVAPGFLAHPKSTTVFNGDPAVFTATAATTGAPNYKWQHLPLGATKWTDVVESTENNPTIFTGTKTATLNLATTTLAMNRDKFRVVVSDTVGSMTSNAASLLVTEFQSIQTEVLGQVDFNEIGLSEAVPNPTNGGVYFATGLPKGLTIDPETGIISGTVTAKAGTYLVTYGSTNGKKRNPQQFSVLINVAPFSSYLSGTFEALPFSAEEQSRPTGKIKLTVTGSGSFTGSYLSLLESKSYSFKGQLALNQDNRSASPAGNLPVIISRGRGKTALQLAFTITEPPQNQNDAYSTLTAILHEVDGPFVGDSFSGIQIARFSALAPAPWAGNYTARLTNPVNQGPTVALPGGSGYATLAIKPATGVMSMKGRLSEGTQFTASLSPSGDAKYLIAQRAHSGVGGSLAGTLTLATRFDDETLYHSSDFVTDRLYWVKTPDKNYPAGFGPLALTLRVEPWLAPGDGYLETFSLNDAGEFKVNIASGTINNGAINNMANPYLLPLDLRLSTTGQITVPPTTSNSLGNPTGFKISVNSTSGLLTGSFTVAEPIIPPAKTAPKRLIKFEGVMSQAPGIFTNDIIGEGYFLIAPLTKGAPTTSGLIELRAGEPESPFGGDSGNTEQTPITP